MELPIGFALAIFVAIYMLKGYGQRFVAAHSGTKPTQDQKISLAIAFVVLTILCAVGIVFSFVVFLHVIGIIN